MCKKKKTKQVFILSIKKLLLLVTYDFSAVYTEDLRKKVVNFKIYDNAKYQLSGSEILFISKFGFTKTSAKVFRV